MRSDLPEELQDAISTLEDTEKKVANGVAIESFTEALAMLNEYADDYPEHNDFIKNITSAYIRRIVDLLYTNRPAIDQEIDWLYLIVALFVKHKSITVGIVEENKLLKTYFIELLGLWAEKAPSELRDVLDEMLEVE